MKKTLSILALVAMCLPASATISLSTQYGVAYDSSGVAVPDGTLWALVVDSNASNNFAGGFGLNSSLVSGDASSAFTAGQSLQLGGLLGGDTVFAMGGFNGAADAGITGLYADALTLTLGENGLATGLNYAFYWFPGATFSGGGSQTIGSQVGGIHAGNDAPAGLEAMVIPADAAAVTQGAASVGDASGAIPAANFQAVNLIPEPSVALLGALGLFGLLRRRR